MHHHLNEDTLANARGKQLFINSASPGPESLTWVIALNYTTKWKSWFKEQKCDISTTNLQQSLDFKGVGGIYPPQWLPVLPCLKVSISFWKEVQYDHGGSSMSLTAPLMQPPVCSGANRAWPVCCSDESHHCAASLPSPQKRHGWGEGVFLLGSQNAYGNS